MRQCHFQVIIGETPANKLVRRAGNVSYGIAGLLLVCVSIPSLRFLMPLLAIAYTLVAILLMVIGLAKIELYKIGGVIKLSDTDIILDGLTIQAADLRRIEVKFNLTRGQGAGRNGFGDEGNKIIIITKSSNEMLVVTVLIEARAQRDNLAALLREWRKMGIKVSADGIDLV
jgi:hypothetical protein